MSKKTIALIIALFAVTLLLLALAILPVTQKTTISITPTPAASVAETVLALAPPVATGSAVASESATYSMDINILTGENKVNAVQVELSYNPAALVNVDIKPGDFFADPIILLKSIDTETGRISYAVAVSPGVSGKSGTGTVAKLIFKPLGSAATTINFLPKTQVAAEGVQASVLKSTTDATIFGGSSSANLSR